MTKSTLVLLFLAFSAIKVNAQQIFSDNNYPLTGFRPPLDILPPALAGSFGELRANHFHSGMDYRTNQRQGYPVHAVADGYISRMRVQNSGFGLALYINHPNGFTSVYGHLSRFSPKIAQLIKAAQYQKKSFEVDEFPDELLIPIHKGEVIAYSGNTGSSGGPHLHFEVRNTKTEATINPLLFGFEIPDNIPPVIYSIYVYNLDKKPFNEHTPKRYLPVTGGSGSYKLSSSAPLSLTGEVGFGIMATDRHTGASGLNGVYSIELFVDEKPVFTSSVETFAFENSRGINAHIDYPLYMSTKRRVQKSFVDPGNPLSIYTNLVNRGRIDFNDGALHQLKYVVTDGKGNKSILSFQVKAGAAPKQSDIPLGSKFSYAADNKFHNDEVKVVIPKGSLYNNLDFEYKTQPRPASNAYSAIHQIHNKFTPLHTGFELWIKADSTLGKYKDKALIVNTDRSSQGGYYEDGYVKAKPREFGSFFISVDTIAPVILPQNVSNGKSMAGISKMAFKIRDNLSGIKSFNGYIDGKWVLMEFDAKTASLWHTFDERTATGKHTFELIVADMKDNIKNYSITFYK